MKIEDIDDLVARGKLTQHGADWLTTALDPFHDYNREFEGLPDLVSGKSKVQCAISSLTIASPDGNPYSAKVWISDTCTISPGLRPHPCTLNNNHLDVDTTSSLGYYGTVVAEAWNGAVNPITDVVGANLARQSLHGRKVVGQGRCVALGFEVHNTTPPINMSGTMTASTIPTVRGQSVYSVYDSGAAINAANVPMRSIAVAPNSPEIALNTPGAVQWPASRGAYVVARACQPDFPVRDTQYEATLYGANVTQNLDSMSDGVETHVLPVTTTVAHDFDRPYVLLTGLSAESTFAVTLRCYFEYFPETSSSIMPFATPSPAFDPRALSLYGLVAQELPIAVPVNMNAKGDYFRMVMGALGKGLRVMAPTLGVIHPAIPPAAIMAGQIAGHLAGKQSQQVVQQERKKGRKRIAAKRQQQVGWGTIAGVPSS
jgi:hypothetical protein